MEERGAEEALALESEALQKNPFRAKSRSANGAMVVRRSPISTRNAMPEDFERYRSYLLVQAQARLHPAVRARVSASDVVQETLIEAHRDRTQRQMSGTFERAAWLRAILGHNLQNAVRDAFRDKRDARRDRNLDAAVEDSCRRVASWVVEPSASPSQGALAAERELVLAQKVAELPDGQQEAIVLRYWEELSLEEIARRMDRTTAAVAGLLHRGIATLRERGVVEL